ncbi:dehydrase and lipid transport-domain-containing protein [Dichotomopilus funicola]|uniref:Dehydrase and lipid transport-domain-containing protein n=1 Tax=Dichotomopilus funicola TaxID=1934379 RepID=A0AAN6VAN3_9PEZI|nr:dehydrase and lipid transport-domain-containing protein [Dichotomopilus funicola]
MAPRLPPPARQLFTTRPSLSPHLHSSLSTLPISHPTPLTTTTPPTRPTSYRPLSTTPRHPFLLSALSSLTNSSGQNPPPPKTIHVRRVLPYRPSQIYTLITDIDAYTHFIPHCPHSRVTQWIDSPVPPPPSQPPTTTTATTTPAATTTTATPPPTTTTRLPALADLTVGWGPFTLSYTSRVYCIPGRILEAVSGNATTGISADVLRSVGYPVADGGAPATTNANTKMEALFESLATRWTVEPIVGGGGGRRRPQEQDGQGQGQRQQHGGGGGSVPDTNWTEVTLSVSFQFANPALGFAVGRLADEKAEEMVQAFEGRARQLYGR